MINVLAITPDCQDAGFGTEMICKIISLSIDSGSKFVRMLLHLISLPIKFTNVLYTFIMLLLFYENISNFFPFFS